MKMGHIKMRIISEMREDIEQTEKVKVCLEQLYKKERQLTKSNNHDLGI